jgi:hypothetical protein
MKREGKSEKEKGENNFLYHGFVFLCLPAESRIYLGKGMVTSFSTTIIACCAVPRP